MELLGKPLRRHRPDAGGIERIQTAQIHRQAVRRELRDRLGASPAPDRRHALGRPRPLSLFVFFTSALYISDPAHATLPAMTPAVPPAGPEIDADVQTVADLPFHMMGRFPKARDDRPMPRENQSIELSSKEVFERIRDLSLGLSVRWACRRAIASRSSPRAVRNGSCAISRS